MKAIIPTAGQGTRLYPQTHTRPKAMVRLAGRPILGHILSSLAETRIEDVVIVVGGPMQEQIVDYADSLFDFRFDFTFLEQERAEGLGHSIYQAASEVRGDSILIALGDMLFENGYREFLQAHDELSGADGSIGVKRVDSPRHYGVVETNEDGEIVRLVEKPDDPLSDLAISGAYVVEDTPMLFDQLEHLVENGIRGSGGEYQLTDALQGMVEAGASLRTFEVDDWYDCGRPETLLEANRVLLSRVETANTNGTRNTVVVPPVDFGEDVTVEASVVGPNLSIDDGVRISGSIVRDCIIGRGAVLEDVNLEESIVGAHASVESDLTRLNVGDNSNVNF